eukprot:ANDGO_00850.mRNA.1 hypothetical protein SARC_04572
MSAALSSHWVSTFLSEIRANLPGSRRLSPCDPAFQALVKSIPKSDRLDLLAMNHILVDERHHARFETCFRCWHRPCACESYPRLHRFMHPESASLGPMRQKVMKKEKQEKEEEEEHNQHHHEDALEWNHEVLVWMHFRELFKSSNSGKLLPLMLPEGATDVCVYGVGVQDAKMRALWSDPDECSRTAVLFPSADAFTPQEWVREFEDRQAKRAEKGLARQSMRLVLVDCVWSQAGSMRRSIPDSSNVAFVRLGEDAGLKDKVLFEVFRKRTRKDGMSTLEAYVQWLRETGWNGYENAAVTLEKALLKMAANESDRGRLLKKPKRDTSPTPQNADNDTT